MEVISIGSSSAGNSYIIKTGSENLLLDVGLSAAKIIAGLRECDVAPEDVSAILITHEHIDHVRSVRAISRKCPCAQFYTSHGTEQGSEGFAYMDEERVHYVQRGDCFALGTAMNEDGAPADETSVMIRCFGLSHDAREPIGYSILADGEQLTVVTDTGIITEEIYREMLTADILVFEANHEEELLLFGPYPYSVKMRIKSDIGHLSNVTSAEVLARLLEDRIGDAAMNRSDAEGFCVKPPVIMLAHLSEKNNTPYQARITIEDILGQHGFRRNEHYILTIAAKDGLTFI